MRPERMAYMAIYIGAYGKAGIRSPEPELKLGNTETSSLYPCGNKMASSVIIALRNFQHSDRDTKGILTFGK